MALHDRSPVEEKKDQVDRILRNCTEAIYKEYKKTIFKRNISTNSVSLSRPWMVSSQISSILQTATSNQTSPAIIKWDGLKLLPELCRVSSPSLPFVTTIWLSSLPPSPPWSTTCHPQCPTILFPDTDPDFHTGHVLCHTTRFGLQHKAHAHLKHHCHDHTSHWVGSQRPCVRDLRESFP